MGFSTAAIRRRSDRPPGVPLDDTRLDPGVFVDMEGHARVEVRLRLGLPI